MCVARTKESGVKFKIKDQNVASENARAKIFPKKTLRTYYAHKILKCQVLHLTGLEKLQYETPNEIAKLSVLVIFFKSFHEDKLFYGPAVPETDSGKLSPAQQK